MRMILVEIADLRLLPQLVVVLLDLPIRTLSLKLFDALLLFFSTLFPPLLLGAITLDSFFEFFAAPDENDDAEEVEEEDSEDGDSDDEGEDDDDDDDDGDDDEDDQTWEELPFEVGEELKDTIIPYAMQWYTGEALLYESEEEDDSNKEIEEGNEEEASDDD
ncbi:uncharacterized protein BDZ99DRAFT_468038 [Mytilinidion resinicola]|uniref:Uncharacterized protein n=1 Tax=Mytilinidion resinicola TaxID=574789 RepID=A0A6A6Y3S4_9PEZI|nr:uncharacterized protein BDZ99DRAFT_468038 [Mytilinidion resinicola]KAF2803486.1 hypothetical protein BDZ99DRAFT_468038 [Mytilinidion resinicola]